MGKRTNSDVFKCMYLNLYSFIYWCQSFFLFSSSSIKIQLLDYPHFSPHFSVRNQTYSFLTQRIKLCDDRQYNSFLGLTVEYSFILVCQRYPSSGKLVAKERSTTEFWNLYSPGLIGQWKSGSMLLKNDAQMPFWSLIYRQTSDRVSLLNSSQVFMSSVHRFVARIIWRGKNTWNAREFISQIDHTSSGSWIVSVTVKFPWNWTTLLPDVKFNGPGNWITNLSAFGTGHVAAFSWTYSFTRFD